MADVARFLNLANAPDKGQGGNKSSKGSKKVTDRRKLKRELDKLMKSNEKALKALDDHKSAKLSYDLPANDVFIEDDGSKLSQAYKAGRIVPPPDIQAFPGIPTHCIPDLLMVWDFLCTFGRTLSLEPINLDDFASALTFRPIASQDVDDEQQAPIQ